MSGILEQLLGLRQAQAMQAPNAQQMPQSDLTPEEMMRLQQILGSQTLDLTTGRPATSPPIGSNQMPQGMGMPPMQQRPYTVRGMGSRNEGIYPR